MCCQGRGRRRCGHGGGWGSSSGGGGGGFSGWWQGEWHRDHGEAGTKHDEANWKEGQDEGGSFCLRSVCCSVITHLLPVVPRTCEEDKLLVACLLEEYGMLSLPVCMKCLHGVVSALVCFRKERIAQIESP